MTTPIWQMEIRVHDLQRSIAFYRAVFDWHITPLADDYAMIDTGRAPIASLWQVGDSGMPLGICHYLHSRDCAADAAQMAALGGRIAVERTEIPDVGAWTDTLDPWQNEVAFWQPATDETPELVGSGRNPLGLVECATTDLEAAIALYGKLAGWQFSRIHTGYALCTATRPPVALVAGEEGARRRGILDYIAVADLDATTRAVAAAGGSVLGSARDLGDGSLVTLILDPDSNQLAVLQKA